MASQENQAKEIQEQVMAGASAGKDDNGAGKDETHRRGRRRTTTEGQPSHASNGGRSAKPKEATSTPVRKITIESLKEQLRRLKLPTTGNKAELLGRLTEYEQAREESDSELKDCTTIENVGGQDTEGETEVEDNEEVGDDTEESDDDENERQRIQRRRIRQRTHDNRRQAARNEQTVNQSAANLITVRDIEDSVSHFSGDDQVKVERWVDEFEDTSELLGWSDLQKVIYGKKLLRGSAKQYMSLQKGIITWKAMKKRLLSEFQTKYNSATVHAQLIKRKRQSNETPRQYVYAMQTIASQGDVEEEALIQYIIDGILDEESNKSILYGSDTVTQLRKNLEHYDRMKERSDKKPRKEPPRVGKGRITDKNTNKTGQKERKESRCFSCGSAEHIARDCPHKNEGPKCFKCNKFGHIAMKCDAPGETTKKDRRVNVIGVGSGMPTDDEVTVVVNGVPVISMMDTGTHFTLLRFSEYQRIGSPPTRMAYHPLYGLGRSQVIPVGVFSADLVIQGDQYKVEVYVIPNDAMDERMLLGKGLTRQMDIRMKGGMLFIKKLDKDVTKEDKDNKEEVTTDDKEEKEDQEKDNEEDNEEGSNIQEDENSSKGQRPYEEAVRELCAVNYTRTDPADVNEQHRRRMQQLIDDYAPKKDTQTTVETRIILKDEAPVSLKPRRLAVKEKAILNAQIDEWLREGIIQPSSSRYSSPVVIVPKKNGTYRVCIDYRQLNRKILRDRFPMPLIDDRIDALAEARVFSVLDLKNGFFHVPVAIDSRQYTSFVTPEGQYEFLRTPFGLCNSPTSFLRFIDEIFRDLGRRNIVFTYMDDLIVPGKDEDEALTNLKETLTVAAKAGLIINWEKCELLQRRVEYLGHVVENGCIGPSPAKVKGVRRFPTPTTKKAIHSFLGLTGYFRKFIRDYAKIARPLSEVLKEGQKFRFEEEQRQAFEHLKKILTTDPILQIYRPDAITELHTDASKEGYGAILLQRRNEEDRLRPVYYMSRKTTDAEKKYHSYELEALAIITAVKKFRVYLLGVKFKIITDCSAFQKTLDKVDISPRVARWALTLEEFDYEIEHRSGTRLRHVDALSRYPVMLVEDRLTAMIRKQQDEEEGLKVVKKVLEKEPYEDYSCENNILMKKLGNRSVIVLPTSMHRDIIRKTHDNGHFSVKKMMEGIQKEYYIPKLKEKLEKHVSCCVPCILAEKKRGKKEGELQPIPKGDVPLATYHIDHLGPITMTSKQYKHLFVIVDGFSKFVWIYPTKSTSTKEVLEKLRSQQKIFGNPRRIVSDRGSAFTSTDFQNYCCDEDIEHVLITTGVPRGNGQVERVNRIIIPILTKLSHDHPDKWFKYVYRVQTAINSTYQRSVGTSPFEVLFGVKMRRREDPELLSLIELESVVIFDEGRRELRKLAQENIAQVQRENKRTYNRKHKPAIQYNVGDLVVIKRTQFGPGQKIKDKYLGPYKIARRKRNDRYEVVKEADVEGPWITSSSADQMKPYLHYSSGTEE